MSRTVLQRPAWSVETLLPKRTRPESIELLHADDGLRELLAALDDAPGLTSQGVVLFRRELTRAVRGRLALLALPEPVAPIDDPIIVTGLPRSGTTLVHHLLACVRSVRTLRYWEAFAGPARARRDPVGTTREAVRYLGVLDRLSPRARQLHPMTADGPEECMTMQQLTFASDRFAIMATLPTYQHWLDEAPLAEQHALFRHALELLPRDAHTWWLLKCPTHARHFDHVLATFPRARIVWTHRDPAKVIPSFANLVCRLRSMVEVPDPAAVGSEWHGIWTRAMATMSEGCRAVPPSAVLDVHYPELLMDPVGTVRRICDAFDLAVDDAAETAMLAWLATNPQLEPSARAYRAEDFALTSKDIRRTFAAYIEENAIAIEDD